MGTRNSLGVNIFDGVGPLSDDDLLATTGKVVYVGSTACPGGVVGVDDASLGDRPQQPYATIDFAHNQLTASRGDAIVVLPGHAETVTGAITFDTAGIRVIGLGLGRNRPAITRSGAIDSITITADNVRLHNLRVLGTADTAGSLINISGDDAMITKCVLEHGVGPVMAITVTQDADRWHVDGCRFIGTAAGPDVSIDMEGRSVDWIVENCHFNYANSAGLDLAVLRCDDDAPVGGLMNNCTVIGFDVAIVDFDSSDNAQGDGMISNVNAAAGAAIANIDDSVDPGGFQMINVLVSDNVAASGARVPVLTPA